MDNDRRLFDSFVFLWIEDLDVIWQGLWTLLVEGWVGHDLDLQTKDTLSQENVSGGNLNEVVNWLTGVDHETGTELHSLGSGTLGLTGDDNLDTLGAGLDDVSDDTVGSSSDSQTVQQLELQGFTLGGSRETSVLHSFSVEDDGAWGQLESLLDQHGQLSDSSTLFTQNGVGSGGLDDNLSLGWGDLDFTTSVTFFWQFSGEEFIQFGVEDTVSDELSLLGNNVDHSVLFFGFELVCTGFNMTVQCLLLEEKSMVKNGPPAFTRPPLLLPSSRSLPLTLSLSRRRDGPADGGR